MRALLTCLLLFSVAFSSQINYFAGGSPTALDKIDDKYVVATQGILYVFDENGVLENQLSLEGVSDFSVHNGIMVVSMTSQNFPNIRAFGFPELTPLWDYEPLMDVFDVSLIWDQKQTRSWTTKYTSKGFGVASGYTLYFFSESGDLVGNFTAESDIWDFVESGGFYLATQDGIVYEIDSQLNLVSKNNLCQEFLLLDQVSNQTIDTYPRSVWEISESLIATCEDGYVRFLENEDSYQLQKYTSSQLYSYYYNNRRETGYGMSMFENLKLKQDGDFTVVYTSESLAVFDGTSLLWEKDTGVLDVDIYGDEVYVFSITRSALEVVDVFSKTTGELLRTLEFTGVSCEKTDHKILVRGDILIASSCEIKLLDSLGNIEWYMPQASKVSAIDAGDTTIFFTADEYSQGGNPQFYSLFAVEDEVKWIYSLPETFAKEGFLSNIHVVGNFVVSRYSASGNDRLVVTSISNGTSWIRNASSAKYGGGLDEYLTNETLMASLQNYSFSLLDNIPDDFKYGENLGYDMNTMLLWSGILSRLPVPLEIMEALKHVIGHEQDYLLGTRIEKTDTCDYNGDGVLDIVVSADSYVVVLDGTNMSELLFKDAQTWRYDSSENLTKKYTAPWYNGNGAVMCVDDFSGDGVGEFLIGTWEGNVSVILSDGTIKWQSTYKNVNANDMKNIEDIDGDGTQDFIISQWVENRPNNIFLVSSRDGRQRFSYSAHQFFSKLAIGDIDGDGKPENAVLYESNGPVLTVFSPTYKFEYTGISEFWNVWNAYGKVMPVEIVPDMNDDGYNEIVIGATKRWGDESTMLIFFDGQTKEILKTVYPDGEPDNSDGGSDEWQYVSDMQRFGDLLVFTMPGQMDGGGSSRGRWGVYNITGDRMEAYLNQNIKETFSYGDKTVLIGTSGEIFYLEDAAVPEPTIIVDGSVIGVTTDSGFYTTVIVDGSPTGSGRKSEFQIRLPNGEHTVVVSLTNEDGFEKLFTYEVDTFTSADLGFLNTILIGILLVFGGFKAVKKWR